MQKLTSYCVTLVDVRRRSEVLDSFSVAAFSPDEARELAYQRLKKRWIYKHDPDVPDFVLFHELGVDSGEIHGVDVPTEPMSRLLLQISPQKDRSKLRRCEMEVDTGDHVRIIAEDGETVLAEGVVNGVMKRGDFQDIMVAGAPPVRGANITDIDLGSDGVYVVSTNLTTLEAGLGLMFGCGCGPGSSCGCGSGCGCGQGGSCNCGQH